MNLLKIDRREARRMVREQTYASTIKNLTKENDNKNEYREIFKHKDSEETNSNQKMPKENTKQREMHNKTQQGNIINQKPEQQKDTLPDKQNNKTTEQKCGTPPNCDTANKRQLRTNTTKAPEETTREQPIENIKLTNQKKRKKSTHKSI